MFNKAARKINLGEQNLLPFSMLSGKVDPLFCKGLYLVLFLRIFFSWSAMITYLEIFPTESSGLTTNFLLNPFDLYIKYPAYFLSGILVISGVSIFLPLNLLSSTILLVTSYSLVPMAPKLYSGADLVLTVFLGYAWVLVLVRGYPRNFLNKITYPDLIFFFLKMHLGFIYLQSGVDKLFSPYWRSGEALYIATRLPSYVPAHLQMDLPGIVFQGLSWLVIRFEILFIVLIWHSKTRNFILFTGVIFELIIFWYFSIPDFALVMLCGYIPFLKKGPPIQDFFKRSQAQIL